MARPVGHRGPWVPVLARTAGPKRTKRHKLRELSLTGVPENRRTVQRLRGRQSDSIRHLRVASMQKFTTFGQFGDFRWPYPWPRYTRKG